ncbi:MAG: hypothetical protein ACKO5K_01740, partial [Armatimonadota bacterium]
MTRTLAPVLFAVLIPSVASAQREPIAVIDPVRQVQVAPPTDGEQDFEPAAPGSSLPSGGWVRTRKRSYAELRPRMGGKIRLDENTVARIRGIDGGVAVSSFTGRMVATGVRARLETTGFTVECGSGSTMEVVSRGSRLVVRSITGTAIVARDGKSWTAGSGEAIEFRFDDGPLVVDGPTPLSKVDLAIARSNDSRAWWGVIDRERNLGVFPGSEAAWSLRTSPLTEFLGQTKALPIDPRTIAANPADRQRFLRIAREVIVPVLERSLDADPTLSIAGFAARYGERFVADKFPVGGSDLAFLLDHGIANVGQTFVALDASGASLGIDVRSAPTRSVWRPSSATIAPN